MAEEVVKWIDPAGVETTLGVAWDVTGRFMPPVIYKSDKVPGQDGEVERHVRHGAREFTLPLWIEEASDVALRSTLRALVKAMNPKRGLGKIRVTAPGGDQREINCKYASGLEFAEKLGDTSGPTAQKVAVTFKAFDPYWYATSPTVLGPFTTGDIVNFFPILPIRLSSSQVIASESVINDGDEEAWPVWKITGPGGVIVLRNLTTGQKIEFSNSGGLVLGSGEWVDIDTRPLHKSVVRGSDGLNLFKYLSNDSVLWPLPEGSSLIQLEMSGANTNSALRIEYTKRYLTA